MIKKQNRCTILQEPKHISATIVYADESFCNLSQKGCDILDRITSITDLFIVFPGNLKDKINFKRFASIMNSCGYIIDEPCIEVDSILYCIKYLNEVLKKHLNIFYINNLLLVDQYNIEEDFMFIQQQQLQKNVFNIQRLVAGELKKIYEEPKKSWFEKLIEPDENSLDGMFCTHSTNDDILFLKCNHMKTLMEGLEKLGDNLYTKTFRNYNFGTFLSSAIIRFDKEHIISHTLKELLQE